MDLYLDEFFGSSGDHEEDKLKIEVSQPVRYGYLIRNAFFRSEQIEYYFELSKLPWLVQEVIVAGQSYMPSRETLAFAESKYICDFDQKSYTGTYYTNIFYNLRQRIREIIQRQVSEIQNLPKMNYCWGNRYRDGRDKIGKHKDDEKYLDLTDPIISVSFGVHRYFDIYAGQQRIERVELGHGDIFVMMPGFQKVYYHALPSQSKIIDSRINLTYRSIHQSKNREYR